jgi:hypothetical protein
MAKSQSLIKLQGSIGGLTLSIVVLTVTTFVPGVVRTKPQM